MATYFDRAIKTAAVLAAIGALAVPGRAQSPRMPDSPESKRILENLHSHEARSLKGVTELVVVGVEGELVDGVLGGPEAFGSYGEGAYAGALEAEAGEEVAGGGGQRGGVGGGFGEGTGAGGGGVVGVADGEGQRAGGLSLAAQPEAEVVGEGEQGAAAGVGVELVMAEAEFGGGRTGRGAGGDGGRVDAVGEGVDPAGLGGAG